MEIKNKLYLILLLLPVFALQHRTLSPIKAVKITKKKSDKLSDDAVELQKQVKKLKGENQQLKTDLKSANKKARQRLTKYKKLEKEIARGKKAKTRDEISDNKRILSLTNDIEKYEEGLTRLRERE